MRAGADIFSGRFKPLNQIRWPQMRPIIFFLMLLSLMTSHPGVFAAENSITLGTVKSLETSEGRFLNLVYTEAFKRLEIPFIYKQYPAQRSSFLSDSGEIDGELSRIYRYNETHPNLIRVEEPHWHSGFLAVAMDPSIQLDGWNSLSNTEYRVTYLRGVEGCEINLSNVVNAKNLECVDRLNQGFKKLIAGWTDLVVSSEMSVVSGLQSDELNDSGLRVVGVMEKFSSHAFLNKRHQDLAARLSAVLVQMKKEGLVDEYWKTAKMKSYIKNNQGGIHDKN